jgi:heme-binding protein
MKYRSSVVMPGLIVVTSVIVSGIAVGPQNPPIEQGRTIEAHIAIPDGIHRILQRSCYDCHSNQTRWPWYSRLPGVSILLRRDIDQARRHLNLSDWSTKLAEGPDEAQGSLNGICEELRTDTMPIPHYRWLHRDAALSPSEVETVCSWTSRALASASKEQSTYR